MFKEIKRNGTDSNGYTTFKIIDDDFEEETEYRVNKSFIRNIIEVYSQRNLNVAANLALVFKYYNDMFGYSFEEMKEYYVNDDSLCSKTFAKYEDEVKKYLLLI
jgi:hypothetical protein